LSPDPIGADRNSYRYSFGDSVNFSDPSGLLPCREGVEQTSNYGYSSSQSQVRCNQESPAARASFAYFGSCYSENCLFDPIPDFDVDYVRVRGHRGTGNDSRDKDCTNPKTPCDAGTGTGTGGTEGTGGTGGNAGTGSSADPDKKTANPVKPPVPQRSFPEQWVCQVFKDGTLDVNFQAAAGVGGGQFGVQIAPNGVFVYGGPSEGAGVGVTFQYTRGATGRGGPQPLQVSAALPGISPSVSTSVTQMPQGPVGLLNNLWDNGNFTAVAFGTGGVNGGAVVARQVSTKGACN